MSQVLEETLNGDIHNTDAMVEYTPDGLPRDADMVLKDEHAGAVVDGEDDEDEDEEHDKDESVDDKDDEDIEAGEDDNQGRSVAEEATVVNEATSYEKSKPATLKKRNGVQVVIPVKIKGNFYLSRSQIASAKIHSSLASHNEPAKIQHKNAAYTIQHQLSSDKPFSIIAYNIPSGPYAGRVAWVADPDIKVKFRFLELPPEVRNMVYNLLFVRQDSTVSFDFTEKSSQGSETVSELVGSWRWTKTGVARNRRDWCIEGLALLATCKDIREEAAGVIYGCNTFQFQKTTATRSFLAAIGGRNRMLIRAISTGWIVEKDAKATAKLLFDCKQLEMLHLDLSYMNIHPYNSLKTPEKVVPLFKPVLKQMFAYLYSKHVRDDTVTREKTFNFFTKCRVSWELLEASAKDTTADKALRREYNRQMKARILEAANAKKVVAAQKLLVVKRMAAATKKEAAAQKKRAAAQREPNHKQKILKPKRAAKKPAVPAAAPAQAAVADRVTRSQSKLARVPD